MSTIANLLIRINADIGDLDRKMDQASGAINRMADRVTSLGKSLTIGVTTPLALAGGAAVSAAAEMDSLTRGLEAVAGSATLAGAQMGRLKELARAPGIGFQEAIQASTRLQAVGFSAEQAERSLKAFANAIALTGGGRRELESVTIQLGQLAAKGKVLAQDLRPIIEASPAVATALKQMFGTVDSEQISDSLEAAGLSTEQFVDLLVRQLGKLPQVTGGVKNSFENLSDSVFRLRAAIGNQLLPVIVPIVERLAALAEAASKTDPAVTRSRIALAGVAALGGPLVFALGSITTAVTSLATAIGVGLLPVIAVGAPVMIALGALAKQFIEDGLQAAEAASKIDKFRQSLASIESFGLAQAIGKQNEIFAKIDLIDHARIELEKLDEKAKRSQKLFASVARPDLGIQPTDVGGLSPAEEKRRRALQDIIASNPSIKELNAELDKLDARIEAIRSGPPEPVEDPFQLDLSPEKAGKTLTALEQQAATVDRVTQAYAGLALRQQDTTGVLEQALSLNDQIEAALQRQSDLASATANELRKQQDTLRSSIPLLQKMADLQARVAAPGLPNVPPNLKTIRVPEVKVDAPSPGFLQKMLGATVAELAAALGPLAAAAAVLKPVFDGLREALGPTISALAKPLEVMGRILGEVVAPVLEILAPPLEAIATLFSVLIQPLRATVGVIVEWLKPGLTLLSKIVQGITWALSFVTEGIGWFIKGLGVAIDKLIPDWISKAGKGLAQTGQEMIDASKRARQGFDAVADAAEELSASLSNVPAIFDLALRRRQAMLGGSPSPVPPAPAPHTPTGGGAGGVVININNPGAGVDGRGLKEQLKTALRYDPEIRFLVTAAAS